MGLGSPKRTMEIERWQKAWDVGASHSASPSPTSRAVRDDMRGTSAWHPGRKKCSINICRMILRAQCLGTSRCSINLNSHTDQSNLCLGLRGGLLAGWQSETGSAEGDRRQSRPRLSSYLCSFSLHNSPVRQVQRCRPWPLFRRDTEALRGSSLP